MLKILWFKFIKMDHLSIAGLALGLTLIVLSNIPVLRSFFRHKSSTQAPGYYHDEDGDATESSLKAFGDKWPRRSIAGFSLIGLTCASVTAIMATIRRSEEAALPLLWCQFAGWVSLSIIIIMLASVDNNRCFPPFNQSSSLQRCRSLEDLPLPTAPSGPAWA
jgi:hypothetical protein